MFNIFAKIAHVDKSKFRDENPGSSNLWREKEWKWDYLLFY